jgi:carboxymethylenebutenolidase
MRQRILALGCLLAVFAQVNAQKMSCCSPSATDAFSQLGSNTAFTRSHPIPLPYHYRGADGKAIVFKAPDGSDAYGWEIKAAKPTDNYIFVVHEWWGLNDYIKKESDKLYTELGNVNIIAIDLYDQKVATTREDAAKYMQAVTTDRASAIIKGAIAYVGPSAKIYTIGWCFGGGWSLQTSLMAGKQAAGCVMYYGMPEKDQSKLKNLNADVLAIFANKDQWINTKVADEFAVNMTTAGKKIIVKKYDADHGFANPSAPAFDKSAREDAYANEIAFFKARIK